VGALTVGPEYDSHFQTLYKFFIAQLQLLLPPGTNIPEAYNA
jgi:exportin-1